MPWRRFPRWRHWIPATILAAKSKVKNIVTNVRKTQICKNNIHIYKRLPTKLRKYIDLTKELQKYLNNHHHQQKIASLPHPSMIISSSTK